MPDNQPRHGLQFQAARGDDHAGDKVPAVGTIVKGYEQDVLNVRELMLKEYNADPNRVYLMGNSSGGTAVWNIGAKYPQLWTAISIARDRSRMPTSRMTG